MNYTPAGHSAAVQENAVVKLCGSVHEVLMVLSKSEVDGNVLLLSFTNTRFALKLNNVQGCFKTLLSLLQ